MDANAVLQVNQRFYQAFENLDLEAMAGVWAQRSTDICIHPGWNILTGWEEIRASWTAIFANTGYMRFQASDVDVEIVGEVARVTCIEHIFSVAQGLTVHSQVACTNVFLLVDGNWRMALHHGSPVAAAHSAAAVSPDADPN
jgi:uncharacterized protein (TIGR02246 family)